MPSLSDIQTGSKLLPPRILMHGPHGPGKTTFASNAPSPIFLFTEEGQGKLDVARFPLLTSLDDVFEALDALIDNQHEYKTVVIDSLDWLEPLIWDRVCQDGGKRAIEDFPYGAGYANALSHWRTIMSKLDTLWTQKKMIVVLIAHAEVKRFEDPAVAAYDRFQPKLHKKAAAVVMEWCDAVLFATFATVATSDKATGKVKAVGKGERVMYTEERPAYIAKNRHDLPQRMPLDWAEFIAAYKGGKNA